MPDTLTTILQALSGPLPSMPRPTLGAMPAAKPLPIPYQASEWDRRTDGTRKGNGFMGALARPDGGVSSELSISTDDFAGSEFPLIVPTLTPQELQFLLTMTDGQRVPDSIVEKSVAWARQRQSAGEPLFARRGEESDLYPQFDRVPVVR